MKKKNDKDERTLFEKLFDEKICFAIVVSRITFKSVGAGFSSIDYGCIITTCDKSKTKRLGLNFYQPRNGKGARFHNYNILEHDMNDSEVLEFKGMQKKFMKVEQNEHGRIYELLTDSFKKKYDSLNKNPV